MAKGWTPGGNVTARERTKSSVFSAEGKDKFPIFDAKSASSALKLIGKAPASEQAAIRAKAAKFGSKSKPPGWKKQNTAGDPKDS